MFDAIKFYLTIKRARKSKQPYKLNFVVTQNCNSRCQTCNIWKAPSTKELTLEEIKGIFAQLPDTLAWISLTGGEPFLRKDLIEIARAAVTQFPNLYMLSIPTNGLLRDKIEAFVSEACLLGIPRLVITYSVDGTDQLHDEIRGVRGNYDRLWNGYNYLRRKYRFNKRVHFALESTVSPTNLKELPAFLTGLITAGHNVFINLMHSAALYHNARNTSGRDPIPELSPYQAELKTLLSWYRKYFRWWIPEQMLERFFLKNTLKIIEHPDKNVIPCTSGRTSLAILAHGEIRPCLMWDAEFGNLREDTFATIWGGERKKKILESIHGEHCPNCWTHCEAVQSIIEYLVV